MPDAVFKSGALTERYWFDVEGKDVVETTQDAQPVLDRLERIRNQAPRHDGEFELVAEIPMTLYLEWRKQGLDILKPEHQAMLEKKLRDIEYKKLLATEATHRGIKVKGAR
jgi:hypothetical protein